ncbi:pseudouridine synthase [Pseudaquabacterium rugosum]|uniref:Pseudouridine synthase n=1 Tax=Pseudaquabacterium rugosum TaxID=2984194 RepID=A0ABU9BD23_9BURK
MSRPRPLWCPPMREGVSPSRVAMASGHGTTVLDFLHGRLPRVDDWAARLARGDVLDAEGRPVRADERCRPGQVLWYWRAVPAEPPLPGELRILAQDAHLLAVDKPHFMSVAPGGRHLQQTVVVQLKRRTGIETLSPMHRLDRETAGVMLVIVAAEVRDAYHGLLRTPGRVHKTYEAVAPWRPELDGRTLAHRLEEVPSATCSMQMRAVDGEPNAWTEVSVLRRLGPLPAADRAHWGAAVAAAAGGDAGAELAHYRLHPITGRKHQLRAQMAAMGAPLIGDRIYPVLWPEDTPETAADFRCPLQLMAREIRFDDPVDGRPRHYRSGHALVLADAPDRHPAP